MSKNHNYSAYLNPNILNMSIKAIKASVRVYEITSETQYLRKVFMYKIDGRHMEIYTENPPHVPSFKKD